MPNQYVNKVVTSNGTTLIDLTGDTVTSSDHILSGYVGHLADGSQVTGTASGGSISIDDIQNSTGTTAQITSSGGGGGGTSATEHEIYFEFTDGTDATIPVYYDDALISTMITSYAPATYSSKTVDTASLDGTTWYTKPSWETVAQVYAGLVGEGDGYFWIQELADVYPVDGEVWRITLDGTPYITTARTYTNYILVGNPVYEGGEDDGSGCLFSFSNNGWGAWSGGGDSSLGRVQHYFVFERQVSA